MIELKNNISINQIIEATKKETDEKIYYYWDDDASEWMEITKNQYNKIIRGNRNGK